METTTHQVKSLNQMSLNELDEYYSILVLNNQDSPVARKVKIRIDEIVDKAVSMKEGDDKFKNKQAGK